MHPYININQLQKQVDDFHLGPVNLTVEPGTITALIGNNGSGKSTLLKLIMNQVKPDTGNIKVFNKFVYGQDESWKNMVAYQSQTMIGYSAYSGKDLQALIAPLYPNWDEKLFKQLVDLFQIPLNKRYSKLSQGVQQKLNLALIIPRNTPLLLLDEPTSFIDIPSKNALMDILVEWIDQDERAIVFASHQTDSIMKLADYLCIFNNGKMLGTYEKEELTETYKRYWVVDIIPEKHLPGEVTREKQSLVSNQPLVTEEFLQTNNINWTDRKALNLEEIITLLLRERKEG